MFKKIFGSLFPGGSDKAPTQHESYDYSGYIITPCPVSAEGGYRVEAKIEKEIDGEMQSHHFIRSDVAGSEKATIELIINKVKMCIDQRGDQIFD